MSHYHISLNQFAEFSKASSAGKARIVKQQVEVNKFFSYLIVYQTIRTSNFAI